MSISLINIIWFAFPAFAVILGGAVSMVFLKGPGTRIAIQHFSAGVIFAALATELLPDVMHRNMPIIAVIGFSVGVAVMLSIKYLTERISSKTEGDQVASDGQPIGALIGVVLTSLWCPYRFWTLYWPLG